MTDKSPLLYWDSCPFIALIGENKERREMCRLIMKEAEKGNLRILTSAFTFAEVIRPEGQPILDTEQELQVLRFLANEYIIVRWVDRQIGDMARQVSRQTGLKPPNAIHVATALRLEAEVLHTYDQKMLRQNRKVGIPPLQIEEPRWDVQPEMPLKD
ncbi:hypothetical protein ES706_02166 [subsurface metagenome]